jgi:hypothetical protein
MRKWFRAVAILLGIALGEYVLFVCAYSKGQEDIRETTAVFSYDLDSHYSGPFFGQCLLAIDAHQMICATTVRRDPDLKSINGWDLCQRDCMVRWVDKNGKRYQWPPENKPDQ